MLGSLLGDEVAFDTVLCRRPGDGGWLDEGVTGLPAGMLTLFARVRCALHDLGGCIPRGHEGETKETCFSRASLLIGLRANDYIPALSCPTLEAVPGRPVGLSNSKLVVLSALLFMTGLAIGDISECLL